MTWFKKGSRITGAAQDKQAAHLTFPVEFFISARHELAICKRPQLDGTGPATR